MHELLIKLDSARARAPCVLLESLRDSCDSNSLEHDTAGLYFNPPNPFDPLRVDTESASIAYPTKSVLRDAQLRDSNQTPHLPNHFNTIYPLQHIVLVYRR